MSDIDFFKFEEKEYDFPFYNMEYPLRKIGLVGLIIAFLVPMVLMYFRTLNGDEIGIVSLILGLAAVGIASKWDYTSICKKLKRSDIKLIFIMLILEIIFAISMNSIEAMMGVHVNSNNLTSTVHNVYYYIGVIFELFGEELFKVIGILVFAYIIYKFTHNRKVSISIGVFLSLTFFGLMHLPTYGNLFHSIVTIGYASIFTVYTYLKTKNILVSYLTHLIFDFIFIGFSML